MFALSLTLTLLTLTLNPNYVVTVSYWLRSVGFGSVFINKNIQTSFVCLSFVCVIRRSLTNLLSRPITAACGVA